MKYKQLKHEALGTQCRDCINAQYGLRLERKDCRYWIYPDTCRCCGEFRNIVTDIVPLSRWKLLLQGWKCRKEEKTKGRK